MTLSADEIRWQPGAPTPAADKPARESQATAMVRLALDAGADLWHTPTGDGYITISIDQHREHHPLGSRGARDYLTRLYYQDAGKAPNASALQDATATLSGMARFDGDHHDVHVRVAGNDDHVYLDLGDPQWRAVEVTRQGWHIISNPPVRFRRPRGLLPLPSPECGGSIEEFRPFVNIASDDDFTLLVSLLIGALRPRGPYACGVLVAEQGSGKSMAARMSRRLIDPNVAPLRAEPREPRDVAIAAMNGQMVALDNVSRLPDWLSDCLARLATGEGFSTRTLYTDDEETIFSACRPILLNGITAVPRRPDLLDRAVIINMAVLQDQKRRAEDELWRAFECATPRILGALLDCVVMALSRIDTITFDSLPRMADFAKWVVAAEPACPWPAGTFMSDYTGNRLNAVEAILDGDHVGDLVRVLAPWEGTASDLLAELNRRTPEELKRRKDWFAKPRQVADALRRLAPALRRVGIDTTSVRAPHSRRRLLRLEKPGMDASPASPEPISRGSDGDDMGTERSASSPTSSPNSANVSRVWTDGDAGDDVLPLVSDDEVSDADDYHGA